MNLKPLFSIRDFHRPYTLLSPYLLRRWKAYAGLLVFVLIDIGMTLAFAWFLGNITDAAVQQDFGRLSQLVPMGAALSAAMVAAGMIGKQLEFISSNGVKKDLAEHVLHHILRLPAHRANLLQSGELLTHLTQDVHHIHGMIGNSLIQLIRLPLIFAAVLVYMLHIHWGMALLSLLIVPFAVLFGGLFGILLRRNSREIHNKFGRMHSLLAETLQGLAVIRSFTLESLFFRRYQDHNQELYALEFKNMRLSSWFHAGGQLAGSAIFLTSLCIGAYFVSNQTISIGSLMSFVNLSGHLLYPLTGLAGLWAGFQRSLSAVDRLLEVLDLPAESPELPSYRRTAAAAPAIDFRHVTFTYDGQDRLFESLTLHIPPGKVVAVVGASGAGKSTLFQLLQGFYPPQSGDIAVNGVSIRGLSPSALRSLIAHVPQETFLFSGTIRDNLLFARPDVSEAEMIAAARQAHIHDFIQSLPHGYDTEVGERGITLSGGQKQRVAIARAVLKDAPILLLDEATSALDSETEALVKESLHQFTARRTTLIIAHRLSTVQHADLIVVLDQGAVVQTGRHEELAARPGIYRNLYHNQFFLERRLHHG